MYAISYTLLSYLYGTSPYIARARSLVSLTLGMAYFSGFYGFTLGSQLVPIVAVSLVTTITEAVCPKGLDNIFVPILGAITFIAMGGGI